MLLHVFVLAAGLDFVLVQWDRQGGGMYVVHRRTVCDKHRGISSTGH